MRRKDDIQAAHLLCFAEPVARFWVEDLLDCPGVGPKDVPVVITSSFLPATFLKILN